jgi:hypothetical protein
VVQCQLDRRRLRSVAKQLATIRPSADRYPLGGMRILTLLLVHAAKSPIAAGPME